MSPSRSLPEHSFGCGLVLEISYWCQQTVSKEKEKNLTIEVSDILISTFQNNILNDKAINNCKIFQAYFSG